MVHTGGDCLKHPFDLCRGLWAEFPPFGEALTRQTNPCSFAWAVTDREVHVMPGQDLSDPFPPWAAALPAGLCQPHHGRNRFLSSEKAAQSTGFLLFVSPAPSWLSRALAGEGTPRNPKARRGGGSWAPLCTPNCLRLQGSSPQLAGHGQPPSTAPGGCPSECSLLQVLIPHHPSQGERRLRDNPLPKGEMC